jgi:hypothetical protein
MKRNIPALCVFYALFSSFLFSGSQKDNAYLIFPDPGEKICIVQAAGKSGDLLMGEKFDKDNPLAKKILEQLDFPYHRSMIKLSQCARNLAAEREGPNVLYLSQTEGGFPRQGVILEQKEKTENYPDLYYVDLVLDEQRLAQGELDIYSHELGHVMMLNIMGDEIPDSRSTKQHVSMGITDYSIAFFEGWGIHFQRLAFDHVPFYRKTFRDALDYSRSSARAWHSNIDQSLRLNGVMENEYIHRKLLPDVDKSALDLEELILLEHTSPVFDRTRLKNSQQMLSCEGVLATLFYRINSNTVLQNSYQDNAFYDRFLLRSIPAGTTAEEIFTPMENAFLKNFYVWDKIKGKLNPESSIFIEFIQEWCRSFPEDREEILKLFIMTTVGKTVTQDLGKTYEAMSYHGMIGDYQRYREQAGQFGDEASSLTQKVLKGELELDANVGPQIWVENKDFLIRTTLWNPDYKKPLSVNLNTASVYDLASFPKTGLDKAKDLIKKREELGYFTSLEQAKKHGFLFD